MTRMIRKTVNVIKAGRLGYESAYKLQTSVREAVGKGEIPDTIILVEHHPVYTIGLRNKDYDEQEEARLRALGADFQRTNRGGLITFHGPGQLVVYPVIDLRNYKSSVRWYVASLEKTIINLCTNFQLEAYTSCHTGVWVNDAKICAIGIHASRYLTTHGLALNCNTDLKWFSHIVPCGIPDKSVTSLTQQLQRDISISQVIPQFIETFEGVFNVKCEVTCS